MITGILFHSLFKFLYASLLLDRLDSLRGLVEHLRYRVVLLYLCVAIGLETAVFLDTCLEGLLILVFETAVE